MKCETCKELLDVLEDVINQACQDSYEDGKAHLDSMGTSAYAWGMTTLAAHGRVVIEKEYGRRVIGHFKPKGAEND